MIGTTVPFLDAEEEITFPAAAWRPMAGVTDGWSESERLQMAKHLRDPGEDPLH
jgi:hypothetical protein